MLDRTKEPQIVNHFSIDLNAGERFSLSNGSKAISLESSDLEVFMLKIVFHTGVGAAQEPATAILMSKLFTAGTGSRTSKEIANAFDQLGGFFEVESGSERTVFKIHGLTLFFEDYLNIIYALVSDSQFPDNELILQKNIISQNLKVSREKTSYWVEKIYKSRLFPSSTFGYSLEEADLAAQTQEKVFGHYKSKFLGAVGRVFLVGAFPKNYASVLDKIFGGLAVLHEDVQIVDTATPEPIEIYQENQKDIQTSIRLGRRLFSRNHPDYFKFFVMNTLFGGYFGSRIMKNIREDKGWTYGISSRFTPIGDTGYWTISADVKKENLQDTFSEIEKEILELQSVKVGTVELGTVKNYLSGVMLAGNNTLFDAMNKHITIAYENLPEDFYTGFIDRVYAVSSEDVMEMAQTYLNRLVRIAVG